MLRWLARQYARRVVNVNANILAAGVAAALGTGLVLRAIGWAWPVERWSMSVKIALTLGVDVVLDLAVALALHALVRRLPARYVPGGAGPDVPPVSFAQDAARIQFQRLCLAPLFYCTTVGAQWALLHAGVGLSSAALLALLSAVLLTRCIHTPWLIVSDRRLRRKAGLTPS